jgi:hypothetical protein
MALGLTQPLTEMSTRCISWGKGGRCVRLTTLPPSCAVFMKSGNLNFLEPSEPLQAGNGADCFTFYTVLMKPTNLTPHMFSGLAEARDKTAVTLTNERSYIQ